MFRNLLIATTILLSSALMSFVVHAEDFSSNNANSDSATDMPKDTWLNTMSPLLPDIICKGFMQDPIIKKQFDEIKMTYGKCVTLITESINKCEKKLYATIPDTISNNIAAAWVNKLGECIGKDFAIKYLH